MRPLFEVKVTDNTKLDVVSLVDKPANKTDAIKMKEIKELKLSFDEDKQTLTGVVLIPEQLIFRRDSKGNEFDIFFTEKTIEQLNEIHMSVANQINTTLDHLSEAELNDVVLVENWIVQNSEFDKSNSIGLGQLPVGTWVQTKKINNLDLWEKVKLGEYNGFSIEGEGLQFENISLSDEQKLNKIIELLA